MVGKDNQTKQGQAGGLACNLNLPEEFRFAEKSVKSGKHPGFSKQIVKDLLKALSDSRDEIEGLKAKITRVNLAVVRYPRVWGVVQEALKDGN